MTGDTVHIPLLRVEEARWIQVICLHLRRPSGKGLTSQAL